SPTRKELKIEIDAADVRAEYDRVSDRYAAQANVPGFRKGRATRDVVRRHYKNQIRGEVVQNLVPQAIQDSIIERNLDVIGEADDINVEAVDVVLGGEGVLQEFTEQLVGTKPDDVKTFSIKYPEDFSAKGLAGKEIEYTATVMAVRRKELPELDDEWARSVGEEIESLADLRAKLHQDLEMRAKFEADQRVRDELMRRLVAAHQFEVPETLVKSQARRLLESTMRNMVQHGIDPLDQEMK